MLVSTDKVTKIWDADGTLLENETVEIQVGGTQYTFHLERLPGMKDGGNEKDIHSLWKIIQLSRAPTALPKEQASLVEEQFVPPCPTYDSALPKLDNIAEGDCGTRGMVGFPPAKHLNWPSSPFSSLLTPYAYLYPRLPNPSNSTATGTCYGPTAVFPSQTVSNLAKPTTDKPRRAVLGCGKCNFCLQSDCGKCRHCRDKTKFGGTNKMRQKCLIVSAQEAFSYLNYWGTQLWAQH